jgi:hypothetical protein
MAALGDAVVCEQRLERSPPSRDRSRTETSERQLARVPGQQTGGLLERDFFTVETLWLRRFYVLFFGELTRRRVYLAGITGQSERAMGRASGGQPDDDPHRAGTRGIGY